MKKHNTETRRHETKAVEVRAVSFDIFDTFLLRACATPEGVLERAFELSVVAASHPHAATSYVQHRQQAEARARKISIAATGTPEVGIDDIYRYFPFRLFGLDRADCESLVNAEFAAELELCRVNTEMFRQYSATRATGARVGFISDTYWSRDRLTRLLRSCQPGLTWDFLYASCESGTNKSLGLFAAYLAEQRIASSQATHIGDNEHADIKGARRHGIKTRFYPQASKTLALTFQRETAVCQMLCAEQAARLDHGFRTLRRVVAARTPASSPLFELGINVLGPALHAFDAFVADRVGRLERDGATAVAFLGRDGFLPHEIWQRMRDRPAAYVAINRRVGVMGAAATLEPLLELLRKLSEIDAATFADITKVELPAVTAFFAQCPNGICRGSDLAEALPDLLRDGEFAEQAAGIRRELLRYLRQQIPNFDDCQELVLVDLGYSGSIQKTLRRILDLEGINIRLHGLYLLTTDESIDDVADQDSFEGFISDLVVSPHAKRMLLRNIAVLEQLCCAPTGSVRGYRNGEPLFEVNPQTPDQITRGREAQAGAIAYVVAANVSAPEYRFAPFADLCRAAHSAAAIVGRLLLLPTDDELLLLGAMTHDVNLGTLALAPMIDGNFAGRLQVARSFPLACTAPNPPMWLAGSMSTLSPAHNFLYLLFGANRLPPDLFDDVECGELEIGLFGAGGAASLVRVTCYRNGFGEIRLRIPISSGMGIRCAVVPVARLAKEGLIAGPFLQAGESVSAAMHSTDIAILPDSPDVQSGLLRSGRYYLATQDDGALVIDIPPQTKPVAVVSIGLTSLHQDRVMAS